MSGARLLHLIPILSRNRDRRSVSNDCPCHDCSFLALSGFTGAIARFSVAITFCTPVHRQNHRKCYSRQARSVGALANNDNRRSRGASNQSRPENGVYLKKRVGVLGSGSAYNEGHDMSCPYISLRWMMLEEIARGLGPAEL